MIRFRTPGPIGERELRAMTQAHAYTRRNHCHALPPELALELRVLGIAVEPAWPEPTEPCRLPVEGRVS